MPKVPVYDNFQVSPNVRGGQFAPVSAPVQSGRAAGAVQAGPGLSPTLAGLPGKQLQQAGEAFQQAGEAFQQAGVTALEIALKEQAEANQLRADDAINQAVDERLRLTHDKDVGFTNLKGINALERPDGKPLADEYGEAYKKRLEEIANGLGNDDQRKRFLPKAQKLLDSFRSSAMQHEASQYEAHRESVHKGTIESRARQIGLEWNDEESVKESVDSIFAASRDLAKIKGKSAIEADEFARRSASKGHVSAIEQALQAGNAGYANKHMTKYRDQIDVDDLVKIDKMMNHQIDASKAQAAVSKAYKQQQQAFAPGDMTRLYGVRDMLESGGKDYHPDGSPVRSSKGALYKNQVMPETAKNPGFGIPPAADNSPEEYNRVGDELLAAMVKRYGRVDQALAAYNSGSGTVDAAIAKAKNPKNEAGGDWFSFMPQETKGYVERGMKAFNAGLGTPTKPTELQFVDSSIAALGPNARPEQIKLATDEAKRRYSLVEQSEKQRNGEIVTEVQRALIANGGNFEALPLQVQVQIPPDKRDDLRKYAENERKGPPKATDWGTYYRLSQIPAEDLAKENLLDYRHQLSDTEFKDISKRQETIGRKDDAAMAKDRNLRAELKQIEGQLTTAGIFLNASEKQQSRIEQRDAFLGQLSSLVTAEQTQTGKPVTSQRVREIAAGMLVTVAGDPEATLFKENNPAWKLMARAYEDIPAKRRDAIAAELKQKNGQVTRQMVVDAWRSQVLAAAKSETDKRNKPL